MSIDITIKCDFCGIKLLDTDTVYCVSCYDDLKEKIEEQEEEIKTLQTKITEMEAKNE